MDLHNILGLLWVGIPSKREKHSISEGIVWRDTLSKWWNSRGQWSEGDYPSLRDNAKQYTEEERKSGYFRRLKEALNLLLCPKWKMDTSPLPFWIDLIPWHGKKSAFFMYFITLLTLFAMTGSTYLVFNQYCKLQSGSLISLPSPFPLQFLNLL